MAIKNINVKKLFIVFMVAVSTMLSLHASASEGDEKAVTIRVEGISETILEEQTVVVEAGVEKTALEILQELLDDNEIEYIVTTSSWGTDYVASINGEEEKHLGL